MPCCRCTSWIRIQRDTNSSMWTTEEIFLLNERIQLLFWSSCCTVRFFLEASRNKFGARFLGDSPSSQLWCQKRVFAPSPKVILVEELKSRRSTSLHGSSEPIHGLESSTHSCHSQRNRRAHAYLKTYCQCSMPKDLAQCVMVLMTPFSVILLISRA